MILYSAEFFRPLRHGSRLHFVRRKKAVQLAWMHLPEACAAQGMCGDCADKKDLAAGL
jgi:hypothetical protein